jgi:hypothetical protein
MANDVANIEFGPCQVTFDGNVLGFFKGGVALNYTVGWYDIEADQSSMIIDSKVQNERCVVTVPMMESELAMLQLIAKTGTYTLNGTKKKIEFGGKQISSSDFKQLVITPMSDGAMTLSTDDNEKVTVHKCIPKLNLSKQYNRTSERIISVEFHAIRDSTKSAGNQLFTLGDTTAT